MKCLNCPKENISHGGPFLDCRFCGDHCDHSPAMPRYERFKYEPACKCIVDNCCDDHWQECICEENEDNSELIERKDMESFIPCGTKLLVKKFDTSEKKSAHGIIISTTNDNETVARGELIELGDYDEAYDFHVGDVLVFPKYAGMAISEELLILKPEDILAKVKTNV
jgi:co-chaperonin GroES (HSP10)